ncbi:biotin carboxylase N-terminal domain-containing protein [Deltaproteobacteria bacterium TL4]
MSNRPLKKNQSLFLQAEAISNDLSFLPDKRPKYFDQSSLKGLVKEEEIKKQIKLLSELDVDEYIQQTVSPTENPTRMSAAEIIPQLGGRMIDEEACGSLYMAEVEFITNGRTRRLGFIAQNRKVLSGVWGAGHHHRAAEKARFFASHGMPLITFMDTPGAAADAEANLNNQSHSISYFIAEMANLQLPSVGIVWGHGYSGGAIPLASTNILLSLKNGVFNTIHPKGLSNIARKHNLSWQECAKYIGISSYELCAQGYFDGIINYTPEEPHLLANLKEAILSAVECIEENSKVFLAENDAFFEHYQENINHYLNPSELLLEENRISDKTPTGMLNIFGSVNRFLRYLKLRHRLSSRSISGYSRLSNFKIPQGMLQQRLASERKNKFEKWLNTPLEIRYVDTIYRKYRLFLDAVEEREKERGKIIRFFMGDPEENYERLVGELTGEILLYLYNYWKGDASENLIQLYEYLQTVSVEAYSYNRNNPTVLDLLKKPAINKYFQKNFQNILLFDLLYNGIMERMITIAEELKGTNQISQASVEILFEDAFERAMQELKTSSFKVEDKEIRQRFFKWLVSFIAKQNCDQIMRNISDWKQVLFPRLSPPLFAVVSYYFSGLLTALYRAQNHEADFYGKITPRNIGIKDFWNRLDRAYKDLLIQQMLNEYKQQKTITHQMIIDQFFEDFREFYADRMTADPVQFPGFRTSIEQALDQGIAPCGAITGIATYHDGTMRNRVGLVISNTQFQAGAFDMASCEKVCKLLTQCASQKLPVIMFISSGGMQTKEGPGALFSMAVMNDRITRFVKDRDLPIICFGFRDCMGGAQASFMTHILAHSYYFSGTMMSFAGQLVVESHLPMNAILSNYLSTNSGSMAGLVHNPFDENIDARLSQIDAEIPIARLTVQTVISKILAGEYKPPVQLEDSQQKKEPDDQHFHLNKIESVLIHARGCTAARLIQAAHDSEIHVVLVQSDPDMDGYPAKLLNEKDRLVCIGGNSPQDSYLNGMSVIRVAEQENVDAIHPGIGFLSESSAYARICRSHGFNFVGPKVLSMNLMGNKSNAIATATRLQIPVVPGSEGVLTDPMHALSIADEIGFPVLIKAAHGGGGKGICVVHERRDFVSIFSRMSREAFNAFGNGDLYLEKFITSMRHLEVQFLRDTHKNAKTLGVRDCSIQRNFQKIIEETAYEVPPKIMKDLERYTKKLIHDIDYIGAGTAEFIFDCNEHKIYFMEMNTRLQVEHPVSEMVTGIDLVRKQFEIAEGHSIKNLKIPQNGHAIEWRINAERVELVPEGTLAFLPDPGKITELFLPEEQYVRVITSVETNSVVSPFYDSMLVQIIAWGINREEAIQRLLEYLGRVRVHGISSNQALMQMILNDEMFINGDYDTNFLKGFLKRIKPADLIKKTKEFSGNSTPPLDSEGIQIPGSKELKVLSPRMGNFFRSNGPAERPFVEEGKEIDTKSTLCLLESMKVFSTISLGTFKSGDGENLYNAPRYQVKRVMAENGQTVSQGDLLFVVEPSSSS